MIQGYIDRINAASDVLRQQLVAYQPEARIVVGNDQGDMFDASNNPIFAIYLSSRGENCSRNEALLGDYAELLLGYDLLAEGSELHDAVRFNHLVADLMVRSL